MKLRRIIGPDVKTALRLVREQLGPDAMILSNRRVPGGVEIVASPEPDTATPARSACANAGEPMLRAFGLAAGAVAAAPRAHAAPGSGPERAPSHAGVFAARPAPVPAPGAVSMETLAGASPAAAPGAGVPPQWLEMQSELRSMRTLLEERLPGLRAERPVFGPGAEGRIWRRLTRIGLPNELVRELLAGVDGTAGWEAAWSATLARLVAGLGTAGDVVAAGGVWAFAGPTGAGKTTTICKLAVRHVLEHGPGELALLSMDAARIGGADMLRAVARLLGVPFHAGASGETIQDALGRVPPATLVLVDTAGGGPRLRAPGRQLEELGAMRERVHTLLVLPANVQLSWLHAALPDYAACAPLGAVVTKLDETASLGELIGALHRESLALAYSTDGPEIPDDLRVADAAVLVAQALALDPEEEPGREPVPAAPAGLDRDTPDAPGVNAARIA
ncbi:MAG: flagellar biosynthesis protein FlhF [Pseudomonadales bacterium]|nr:flagellar biosynthesis protein FlhF [Pseudomonadales bacterium]